MFEDERVVYDVTVLGDMCVIPLLSGSELMSGRESGVRCNDACPGLRCTRTIVFSTEQSDLFKVSDLICGLTSWSHRPAVLGKKATRGARIEIR